MIYVTEKKCFGQRLSATSVRIKIFQFQSHFNCRQIRYYKKLTLQLLKTILMLGCASSCLLDPSRVSYNQVGGVKKISSVFRI